ncbi:carboxylesterase/lipase family protein [Streptacidiphilus fuscans]|uniref:Carboxylic ester hydrolase n=1 Tax=Streptacidiphilus fuscans TaxID=2789292 RepID=A0A931FDD9_9ACTN|nr:carboxylesterase family protein [Streptacidiphilus fuscans]MBF9067461.1 carboxylesterase/lipase family protein [Streptacidiphilus fuscans]
MSEGPVVRTDAGAVRGSWRAGSAGRERARFAEFRGIPYARPPVGALRFAGPVEPSPWEGVREATVFGPAVPQSGPVTADVVGVVDGDDWLTLNVATPDPGAAGLPVLVWIHGGAYIAGTAADPMYDPAALVQAGLVVVSVNYRVGAEGFALIDGAPPNRGFLDQIAALHWVRRNIAAFGGDPGQVTVAGQSAGAGSVAALLTMERARGLFRRAIAHSVPGNLCTPALAASVTATLAERLGVEPTAVGLADVSPARLAEAVTALGTDLPGHRDRWGRLAHTGVAVFPVVDGEVLPASPWAALHSGKATGIDLLVGHTRDEFRLFTVMAGRLGSFTEDEATTMLELFAPTPAAADAYRSAQPQGGPGELLETIGSDALFRMPSLHLARANQAAGGTSFLFELSLESPAMGGVLGACHSLDVPLAFGSLDSPTGRGLLGDQPSPAAVAVSEELRRAWVRFATSGDPGWMAYDTAEQWTRVLDAEPYTGPYPERTSARIWGDHLPVPFALAGEGSARGERSEPAIRTA